MKPELCLALERTVKAISQVLYAVLICGALQAALTACATQYGGIGITGGVEGKMIGSGEAVVVVMGNGFASYQTMQDILLLKSAEMTTGAGFQRFLLLSIEDEGAAAASKVSQEKLAEYVRQKAAVSGNEGAQLRTETTRLLHSSGATATINKSGGGFFVVMYKAGKEGSYDAGELARALKAKLSAPPDKSAVSKTQ
ncbi:MAG: hypothetical protein ABL907_21490 [Hyphomicrobium sp.]